MRRIALALAAVLTVALGAAPAEAKTRSQTVTLYQLERAEGTVRVTFRGDEAAGCRANGLCSVSGTSTYTFGGRPDFGQVIWAKRNKRTVGFYGFADTKGETVSDVVSAGSNEHCVDRRAGGSESLEFEPRSKRVRFNWRRVFDEENPTEGFFIGGDGDAVFDTRCAGPELVDLIGALPRADVPYRVFRSPRSSFRTTGSLPFARNGFAGRVEWDLRYGLRYRGRSARGWFATAATR
jgi:hypothetical protein